MHEPTLDKPGHAKIEKDKEDRKSLERESAELTKYEAKKS